MKDSAHHFFWDLESKSWIDHDRYVYQYDNEGNLIQSFGYHCMADPEWMSAEYQSYSYDSADNQINKISHDWDPETKEWMIRNRLAYNYDSIGRMIEEIRYDWDSQTKEWKFSKPWCDLSRDYGRRVYVYDASGLEVELWQYDWDSLQGIWNKIDEYSSFSRYDSSMNLMEECNFGSKNTCTSYIYDDQGNCTLEIYRGTDTVYYVNTYDHRNHLIERIIYGRNQETNDFMGITYNDYSYNAEGNLVEKNEYQWDLHTRVWYPAWSYVYYYNEEGYLAQRTDHHRDMNTGEWHPTWRYVYFWSPLASHNSENKNDHDFTIYPNPTSGHLVIDTDIPGQYSIEIISLHGTIRYQTTMIGPTKSLNISSLNEGIYMVIIRSEEFIRTEKIILL